jgi:4-coumarate--CoA ligase
VTINDDNNETKTRDKILRGYKDNEEATRESMLAPGWYRTGDVGYLDKNGYLIIVDRIKDVIKYKGYS